MGETQFDAYFTGLWLHYLEYCLLHCVVYPLNIMSTVYLKAAERPGISTEGIMFSFSAAPHPSFPNQLQCGDVI